MNDWAKQLALYVVAMNELRAPLDEASIRAVQDALVKLTSAHYQLLAAGAELAVREGRER